MSNKRPIKKILPTWLTSFNDLTNIHLLLQQQQNQIKALSKAATQQPVKTNSFNSSVYLCKKVKVKRCVFALFFLKTSCIKSKTIIFLR